MDRVDIEQHLRAADMPGLLMGYSRSHAAAGGRDAGSARSGMGFLADLSSHDGGQPLYYRGDGHLLTVGPTGSGKSRGAAIPALLSHPGSIIAVDLKAELYHTTAKYRRSIGQRVICLDASGSLLERSDGLNPMDLCRLPGSVVDEDAAILATLIQGEPASGKDPFWDNNSLGLNTGNIAHIATGVDESERRLSRIREMFAGEYEYTLACLLDKDGVKSTTAREEFQIFLQHPAKETRPSIQSTAQQHFRLMGLPSVRAAMDRSTFDLADLAASDGPGYTIYIVVPPSKLDSHRPILRLWLGVLLQALCRRKQRVQPETLLLIDEAASLGPMEILKRAITLLRGYGVKTWTFWQDLSQIRQIYPHDWQTIVNNAGVLQLLSPRNQLMAKEYADLVGALSPEQLMQMDRGEQALLMDTDPSPQICRRPDYLTDELLARKAGVNPLFASADLGKGRSRT